MADSKCLKIIIFLVLFYMNPIFWSSVLSLDIYVYVFLYHSYLTKQRHKHTVRKIRYTSRHHN